MSLKNMNSKISQSIEPIIVAPSGEFVEAIFAEIERLEQGRINAQRFPYYVLHTDIVRHVSSALNALYKAGRIKVGRSLNDKYITTTTE